ncbi:MAG: P1 family peptidase [candidate division KSB1 bacterium]|nr:P1 family peptidase [candidate division KSB1 bacterium]
MRITVAFNLRTDQNEESAELLTREDVDRICSALSSLRHTVTPVEVSGRPDDVVERLLNSNPDIIFNVAEGTIGSSREAFFPGLYEQLNIPFTGGNASLLHLNLDKHLAKTVLSSKHINVPKGVLITQSSRQLPDDLTYPLMIKPNSEGSSKGITQDSVVETHARAEQRIDQLLSRYPAGLVVEEFIEGKELSIPFLEAFPGQWLPVVEHTFDLQGGAKFNIYDYDMKQGGNAARAVHVHCPADLSEQQQAACLGLVRQVSDAMNCPDFGRVDIRLHRNGDPYFIELNPLPSLHPNASLMTAAAVMGLDFKDVLRLILRSAAKRFGIPLRNIRRQIVLSESGQNPTLRELGHIPGRYPTGLNNAITDVKGVKVGHYTRIQDEVRIPGVEGLSAVRTGVTAIIPSSRVFKNRLVAGGFVLNGVGEMLGLDQILEWGWLETPILLTNSHSVGRVHNGVIQYMTEKHPDLGIDTDVILPVVGEADDSFLNDVRIGFNSAGDAVKAIKNAVDGPVQQGSVGAGAGMITFDFAGGVGTASRIVPLTEGEFTVGVLVLSNFGKMHHLTVEGNVIGRRLDEQYEKHGRRDDSDGSVIVIIATDIPLLSSQLEPYFQTRGIGIRPYGFDCRFVKR